MLRTLLAKDLRRARRNPLPWLINLIVPLAMTALIGFAFGGRSNSGALGRIRFALVDEDKSPLTDLLSGATSQREGNKYLDPVFLDRAAAMRLVNDNKISAVVIIPTNFMRNYLDGGTNVSLELVKNPAESIHPAVLEEVLGAVVTALNALSRNFRSEFPEVRSVLEGKSDYHLAASLVERAGDRIKALKRYLDPPLVSYEKQSPATVTKTEEPAETPATNSVAHTSPANGSTAKSAPPAPAAKDTTKSAPEFNVFGFLLVGMVGMFLLFLAGNGMEDLNRELRLRTFARYQTMNQSLLPFVAGKIVFTVVMLLICSVIMFGGGGLIFHIHWQSPFALMVMTLGYAGFGAGLMAVLVALVADERRASVFTNILGMFLGLAGGCAFPARQLPEFLRHHITPLLPSYWFVDTLRNLESGDGARWIPSALALAAVALGLLVLAAWLFQRRFRKGARA